MDDLKSFHANWIDDLRDAINSFAPSTPANGAEFLGLTELVTDTIKKINAEYAESLTDEIDQHVLDGCPWYELRQTHAWTPGRADLRVAALAHVADGCAYHAFDAKPQPADPFEGLS